MAYTTVNYATKKALKDAVKAGETVRLAGWPVPSFYGNGRRTTTVEGPHYPKPHRWYATVTLDADDNIVTVK